MNCDPLARWYRWMEYAGMGRALERRREAFLSEAALARQVLVLGEGDGRFLRRLLETSTAAEIDCVDASAEMLAAARARLSPDDASGSRVAFFHADARTWQPPSGRQYDLVVTHFFLDCFSEAEIAEMVPRFAACATPEARWIVSEFRQPARGWRAWRAQVWIHGLYVLFGWTTGLRVRRLPEFGPLLARSGFRLTEEIVANAGLLTSQLWARNAARAPTRPGRFNSASKARAAG